MQRTEAGWTWSNGSDETGSHGSEREAWDAAEFEAIGSVMGANDVSSEDWDGMSPGQQIEMAEGTFLARKP